MESVTLKMPTTLFDLLRRTELNYENTKLLDVYRPKLKKEIINYVETVIKYEGYINKQIKQIEQFKKLENKFIPEELDYKKINNLRLEQDKN